MTELPVLFRDEHLIAVAKPSGMFVHRTDKDRSDARVVLQLLRDQIDRFVYPLHRLDRATSGIVLLALTQEAAGKMGRQFEQRQVSKTYRTLVRGHCPSAGVVTTPLVAARGRGKPADHPHAVPQEAETRYETVAHFEFPIASQQHPTTRCSLVDVYPRTGRYHQIRRHFNYLSHPVLGDTAHGDSRHNQIYREHYGMRRLMLAATRLSFTHPLTDAQIELACDPDTDFSEVLKRLQTHRLAEHPSE